MRLDVELKCILFPLIILEMFLHLDWIPPVVKSIDFTWFGQAHNCLYIRSHSWQCMSEQNPSHEVEGIVWKSSETGLCRGTDLGKGTKTCLPHWRFPRTQWPPSFLNGRRLEPPRLLVPHLEQPTPRLMTACLEFAKRHLKTFRPWETRLNPLAWMASASSGGNLAPSLWWSMGVAASCCGDVFQRQELGD